MNHPGVWVMGDLAEDDRKHGMGIVVEYAGRIGGKPTAGVIKDVVMLGGYQDVEFDFVADNPGLTLFHCHQQLHTDFGFMALLRYT